MPSSITDDRHISVFETTLSIQQNTLSVFNVIIQSPQSTVSLIRYPFDFVEFHQKIRFYYPKTKISFPTLNNPSNQSRCVRRRSIRDLLSFSRKSNAEKIERYLQHCFRHPIISISSILRDFVKVQRDEDALLMSQADDPIPVLNNGVINGRKEEELSTALPPTPPPPSPPALPVKHIQKPFSLDQVQLLKVLGKGCMGKVLLVRSKQNKSLYALKVMKKKWIVQQSEVVHTRAERDILVKLQDSPFIAKLNYVFQTPSDLYLLLNYYPGGDIATQLSLHSYFSEQQTMFYTAEILEGLSALHKNNIVYRDLKPENVLIDRTGHIILTDFGLSKIFSEGDVDEDGAPVTHTFCGTAEYLAPEVLLGESYTFVVDFWSMGTLLFEMLTGVTPFWADNHMDMYQRVLEDSLEFPTSFDSITCHFLSGLLKKNPYERLGWGEYGIQEIKSHPYFSRIDWEDVSSHRLVPPYIPSLASETDLSHFDDTFTSMSPRISQSSSLSVYDDSDPFESFSYDPVIEQQEIEQQGTKLPDSNNNGESSTPQSTGLRKRQSTALSFSTNSDNSKVPEDRATKKRQTDVIYQQLAVKPSIPQKTSDMEIASSISSQASLSFSSSVPHVPVTRTGSEVSDDSTVIRHSSSTPLPLPPLPSQTLPLVSLHSPYETPSYVNHDRSFTTQSHDSSNHRYSVASTLANSVCSDLTVSNSDDAVSIAQHSYFPMPPLNQFYS